jgi:dihydroxyacetone kinase
VVCGIAEEGASLERCASVLEEISNNVRTIGVVSLLTDTSDQDRAFIPFKTPSSRLKESMVFILNSLGSTSNPALLKFEELAVEELSSKGLKAERFTMGKMVTSLKMSGLGITI